jgi:hypothetical protein
MVNRQTNENRENALTTGELKIDFDTKQTKFSWIHVLLLIISLYVFLFLPLTCYYVSVRPTTEDNKESPAAREQRKP